MLHEDIRSVAKALDEHKNRVAESDSDTWKLLHNAASNLRANADCVEQLERHFVPAFMEAQSLPTGTVRQ